VIHPLWSTRLVLHIFLYISYRICVFYRCSLFVYVETSLSLMVAKPLLSDPWCLLLFNHVISRCQQLCVWRLCNFVTISNEIWARPLLEKLWKYRFFTRTLHETFIYVWHALNWTLSLNFIKISPLIPYKYAWSILLRTQYACIS
jgi:hypothetical protein